MHGNDPEAPDSELPELPGIAAGEWNERLKPVFDALGEPRYRIRILRDWVFHRLAPDFSVMTDLPRASRAELPRRLTLHPLSELGREVSVDGTEKTLWRRARGEAIESVFIPDGRRRTFCISTQAGCPVKCTFCATGFGGFDGQLSPGEIVDQVILGTIRQGRPPTNIVYMGMGEPLLNAPAVFRSIDILTHPDQFGMGARRITVSTVGVPRRIVELGERHPQVKLAISLHAPRDDLRDEIIPLNVKHPLAELLAAVRRYQARTNKKVTFEYILLPGLNDGTAEARALGALLRGLPSRINLIGFNPFPGATFTRPSVRQLGRFRDLVAREFPGDVTIRRSRGEDISGACGQLSLAAARSAPRR